MGVVAAIIAAFSEGEFMVHLEIAEVKRLSTSVAQPVLHLVLLLPLFLGKAGAGAFRRGALIGEEVEIKSHAISI